MKIEIEDFLYYEVPVKFKLSRYTTHSSSQIITILKLDGTTGFGNAPVYHTRGIGLYNVVRNNLMPFFDSATFESFEEAHLVISERFLFLESAIAHSLDLAIWDIEGKIKKQSLRDLISSEPYRDKIRITEQVFINPFDRTKAILSGFMKRGTQRVKIKIGRNSKWDYNYLKKIADFAENRIELQVDVNETYALREAIEIGSKFKELGIIMWEDPLKRGKWDEYSVLRKEVDIPIMVDGGILSLDDFQRVVEADAADILNFKLNRIGGITNALEFKKLCEEYNVKISVGCAEDLGASMASILHLSSIISDLFGTEGVGKYRLGFDICDHNFVLENGCLEIPEGNGLGVSFNKAKLYESAKAKRFQIYDFKYDSHRIRSSLFLKKYKSKFRNAPYGIYRRIFKPAYRRVFPYSSDKSFS